MHIANIGDDWLLASNFTTQYFESLIRKKKMIRKTSLKLRKYKNI